MSYDPHDTIVAVASASGGAARGIVRVSGPQAIACFAACFSASDANVRFSEVSRPQCIAGAINVAATGDDPPLAVPGDLLVWPNARSYTRQLAGEFHTLGSPPLLAAVADQLCRAGARPARAGEFTLRAFLAGRIDLTQVEAVLGVVDAQSAGALNAALDQLAGGLSRPLASLRELLLNILAELEAGLDFAEEDVEFITREDLRTQLNAAATVLRGTLTQVDGRDRRAELPRVAIVGPPNAGKSSLFNAIVDRYGNPSSAGSIVSPEPGATRDYVSARIELAGAACELVDTAGAEVDSAALLDEGILAAAKEATAVERRRADTRLNCDESALAELGPLIEPRLDGSVDDIFVLTKSDLASSTATRNDFAATAAVVRCSSVTGAGIADLAAAIGDKLRQLHWATGGSAITAATVARCRGSLHEADRALAAASRLADADGDELIAAEIRAALDALGEVLGAISADDVLDRVFSQFCIGK